LSNPKPFATRIDLDSGLMSAFERHSVRHCSDLAGYFHAEPEGDDQLVYEYFEREVPAEEGQIAQNITILHPGTVDGEYGVHRRETA
jgi:hypothetical protein